MRSPASPRPRTESGPPAKPGARGPGWGRRIATTAIVVVGTCEMIVTSAWLDLSLAPAWLGVTIAVVGFLAFLVLVGFTSLVGNAVVGGLVLLLLWREWGWPFWRAALVAAPYWIVFYRIIPKPW